MATLNENEWQNCSDPQAMLEFLKGRTSDRKAKLFAAAAFQLVGGLLQDKGQQRAIELLEQMAEGTATPESVRRGALGARRAIPRDGMQMKESVDDPYFVALMLYRSIVSSSHPRKDVLLGRSANGAAAHAALAGSGVYDSEAVRAKMCRLLRDIFGNPFHAVGMDSCCLTPPVISVAKTIYDQRRFERMPQLADALTAAGCTDPTVLEHCRGEGLHVRGCWAIDLVLKKDPPTDAREFINLQNADRKRFFETIRQGGLICPHCGMNSKDYRLAERKDYEAAVICRRCGWVVE